MALTDVNLFRIDGTVGSVSNVQTSALNGGPLAGTRNRIINGDMRIDQRNNGASVSSGLNVITYSLDRWSVAAGGAAVTAQRLGSSGSFYLNITGAAGNTITNVRQRIEALNVADLAGKDVTLSFVCSSTTATSVSVNISCASAADDFTTVTNTQSFSRSISNVGSDYSISFTLPSQATNGVEILFSLANFTSGIFALTNVQLEPGTVATPFERRSYGHELALCQRYAYAWGLAGHQLAAAYTTGLYSDANQITMHPLGVNISQMRAMPTNITLIGTQGTDWAVQTASGVNQTGFSIATNIGAITANKAGHGLVGNAANLQVLNSNGRIIISSEL